MDQSNSLRLRTQNILDQRINSLVEDGYRVMFATRMVSFNFVKLVHMKNGNVITINANHLVNNMVQKTNGKVTYQGQILP